MFLTVITDKYLGYMVCGIAFIYLRNIIGSTMS